MSVSAPLDVTSSPWEEAYHFRKADQVTVNPKQSKPLTIFYSKSLFEQESLCPQKHLCIVMGIPEFTRVKPVNPLIADELSNPVRGKEKE